MPTRLSAVIFGHVWLNVVLVLRIEVGKFNELTETSLQNALLLCKIAKHPLRENITSRLFSSFNKPSINLHILTG